MTRIFVPGVAPAGTWTVSVRGAGGGVAVRVSMKPSTGIYLRPALALLTPVAVYE